MARFEEFVTERLRDNENIGTQEIIAAAARSPEWKHLTPGTVKRIFYAARKSYRESNDRPIPADTIIVAETPAAPRTDEVREKQFNEMLVVNNLAISCGSVGNVNAVVQVIERLGVNRVAELLTYLRAMEHATQCETSPSLSSSSTAGLEMAAM